MTAGVHRGLTTFLEPLAQRLANMDHWAKSGPMPVFVNKVLLEHSLAHSLTYRLWQLSHYRDRLE